MADQKPSAAPDEIEPRDETTPGAVLSREDERPGGGGLMGASAAAGAEASTTGGTARNAPIDVPTPGGGDAAEGAEAEAESVAAAGEDAPEPRTTSQ